MEDLWAPYDESTYAPALAAIRPDDVVLDIGAGDLRFARRAAELARRVIAVEKQGEVVGARPWPDNLEIVIADALAWPFPAGISIGVLLMRHCTHYREYADKLREAGATRLITNARWGMSVEVVDLVGPRVPYATVQAGWYACDCGAVGFAPGPVETITPDSLKVVAPVASCPRCA